MVYDSVVGSPSWADLYNVAAGQDGYFTSAQASNVGYYAQLLRKHVAAGRVERVRRGIYRLVHYPGGDREDLMVAWLWSGQVGVFSHATALGLYELSDVLPTKLNMTVPAAWRRRRLKVPHNISLHFTDIGEGDQDWFGSVPVTSVAASINACALDALAPDLVHQAVNEALARGLVEAAGIEPALSYLARFGIEFNDTQLRNATGLQDRT